MNKNIDDEGVFEQAEGIEEKNEIFHEARANLRKKLLFLIIFL